MSPLEPILPPGLRAPSGYSHGLLAPAGCRLLFIAGQIGWDATGRLAGGFAAQFAQALDNVLAVLATAGGRPLDLASLTVFVCDRGEYLAARTELGDAWRSRFGRHYPAIALVEVTALLELEARVEIQGVAALPAER